MKMAWGLLTNADGFWVKIVRGKYWPNGDSPSSQGVGQKSKLWRGICKSWNTIKRGMGWALGDGKTVKFWLDNWLDLVE